MKIEKLQKKKDKELLELLRDQRKNLQSLRFSFSGSGTDVMKHRTTRKTIAQILTILNQRGIQH